MAGAVAVARGCWFPGWLTPGCPNPGRTDGIILLMCFYKSRDDEWNFQLEVVHRLTLTLTLTFTLTHRLTLAESQSVIDNVTEI